MSNVLNTLKNEVHSILGSPSIITKITVEGPFIALYTRNKEFFVNSTEAMGQLARKLKKKVVLRLERDLLTNAEEARREILNIIPKSAEVSSIDFDPVFGEVIIEAVKPGLVIGQDGRNLLKIKRTTLWNPKVIRTPLIKSDIVSSLRNFLKRNTAKRFKFLVSTGKRIYRDKTLGNKWVRIIGLGGFREVGRSCILVQSNGSNILLDCGINLASSRNSFPHLDAPEFDVDKLDGVILTHAHLDHCGFVPFLYKYGYRGPVYCTEPTRDLMMLLLLDYLEVCRKEGRQVPFTTREVEQALLHTITLNYNEVATISPDVKLTFYNAGHVLGSAMIHLHIGEGLHNVVYTGDFKFKESLLLEQSENVFPRIETLIMESTYGARGDILPPRETSEKKLILTILHTIKKGGCTLIPVLALGRAQEVMLVLEKYIRQGILPEIPIYIDGLMAEAMAIHTMYPSYLSKRMKERILDSSSDLFPSDIFTKVKSNEARLDMLEGGPCIILATSGMLVGGPSVEYFKKMAGDKRNTIIFVSYQVEGTLGRTVQRQGKGGRVVVLDENDKAKTIEIKMDVESIEGFSGHSDRLQLLSFCGKIKPRPDSIILTHGERKKTLDLASSIRSLLRIETLSPSNLEAERLV